LITRVVIEQFYENFEEATIGQWLKAEGDRVEEKEPLVELITDKVTFEYESPGAGLLRRIVAQEKSAVPVGYIIGVLGDPGDKLPEVDLENSELLAKKQAEQELDTAALSAAPLIRKARAGRGVRATPKARARAREAGIDLEEVAQTADGKMVSEEDVERFLTARQQQGQPC
jgi:pyruvate dehydrogenase E2 component (dihydrolipoamide acetyltransferase)